MATLSFKNLIYSSLSCSMASYIWIISYFVNLSTSYLFKMLDLSWVRIYYSSYGLYLSPSINSDLALAIW